VRVEVKRIRGFAQRAYGRRRFENFINIYKLARVYSHVHVCILRSIRSCARARGVSRLKVLKVFEVLSSCNVSAMDKKNESNRSKML